jgi:hypothetical protein
MNDHCRDESLVDGEGSRRLTSCSGFDDHLRDEAANQVNEALRDFILLQAGVHRQEQADRLRQRVSSILSFVLAGCGNHSSSCVTM